MAIFAVKNQWGGASQPWHEGGSYVLGCRPGQNIVAINISSTDGGKTLTGTMKYAGEGDIQVVATHISANNYSVQNSWGGQPLQDGGNWIIGGRTDQRAIALNLTSTNDGTTLNGDMTYAGEGHIMVDATLIAGSSYTVENSWGGPGKPKELGGTMVLGNRPTKNPVNFEISSADGGKTFTGYMTYETEGHIGFKAELTAGNNYNVQNQWGGSSAPWNDGGVMVIGCREGKQCISLQINSDDGGKTFTGQMTYETEGHILYFAALSTCSSRIG
jgi:hypothetical protein